MTTTSNYPIPDKLQRSIGGISNHIAASGTWWTGTERVAIALESRAAWDCEHCVAAKAALSPNAIEGEHVSSADLPSEAIEAIHRIITDSGRLTQSWHDGLLNSEFTDGHYVELASVIALTTAVDTLHRGLGMDAIAFPEADSGTPSNDVPAEAKIQMAWVPTVSHEDATGELALEWFPEGKKRFIPHVTQALTYVTAEALGFKRNMGAFYLDTASVADPTSQMETLERNQAELLAARVSALNECFY